MCLRACLSPSARISRHTEWGQSTSYLPPCPLLNTGLAFFFSLFPPGRQRLRNLRLACGQRADQLSSWRRTQAERPTAKIRSEIIYIVRRSRRLLPTFERFTYQKATSALLALRFYLAPSVSPPKKQTPDPEMPGDDEDRPEKRAKSGTSVTRIFAQDSRGSRGLKPRTNPTIADQKKTGQKHRESSSASSARNSKEEA